MTETEIITRLEALHGQYTAMAADTSRSRNNRCLYAARAAAIACAVAEIRALIDQQDDA